MFKCSRPFTRLELYDYNIAGGLNAIPCCRSWTKHNMIIPIRKPADLRQAWQYGVLNAWRRSISNGTYSYCNTKVCPYYNQGNNTLEPFGDFNTEGPAVLAYSADKSCNLKCRACRSDVINMPAKRFDLFLDLISDATWRLELMGSGEVLYSPTTLNFLRTFENKYKNLSQLMILTNGTLFTEDMYARFSIDVRKLLHTVLVSVDACSKETYEKIRGFSWESLLSNLNFIKSLNLPHFVLGFVAQRDNQHEIVPFVQFAKDLGCDIVRISTIDDWGHLSRAEFEAMKPVVTEEQRQALRNEKDILVISDLCR